MNIYKTVQAPGCGAKGNLDMIRISRARRSILLATSAMLIATPALAQQGPASAEPTLLDEVVVQGVRASLEAALETKKTAEGVVDSIVAEDIGQFPQSNLAEALQRVSGIQIRRDFAGGVGNEISVRGMPPEFTQVLINGQSAPSNAESRVFNFNVLPAELFRRVDVYKSITADVDEGGIGGTVSLETIRPRDFGDKRMIASLEGVYNEITGDASPRATLVYGRAGDRGGVVVGASYSEFSAASQSYDAVRWTRRNFDTNGDRVNDFTNVFLMDLPRYVQEQQTVERLSLTATGQYRLADNVEVIVDGLYIRTDQLQDRLTPIWDFAGAKVLNSLVVEDGVVVAADYDNVRYRSENNTDDRTTDLYKIGLRGDIDFGPWRFEPYVTTSRTEFAGEAYRFFADRRDRASYDIRQDDDYFTIVTPYDIADPTLFTTSEARRNTTSVVDDELAYGFDLRRQFGDLKVKSGFKLRDRSKERIRFSRTLSGLTDPFAPVANLFSGFLEDEDRATGPSSWATYDFDKAISLYGPRLDLETSAQRNNFYKVDERTYSGYVRATLDRGPWLLDAGVRVQKTEVTSFGEERLRPANLYTERTVESDYSDILPSASLRYRLTPTVYLRAAAARVLTRPGLASLAAYREINESNLTISAQNPDLDPTRANQYDLAAEWYFDEGAILSLGYFYKDVTGFIANETTTVDFNGASYRLTRPVNLNDATLSGFEFNYQQAFDFLPAPFNGLGVAVNYTYTDTSYEQVLAGGGSVTYGLPNNSKDSYNLVVYYENDRFSLRAAQNFRGVFLREAPNEQDGLKYRDDYAPVDVAVRYKLNDQISLTLDVQNILNAVQEEYVFERRLTDGTFTTGRTVQFGLRGKF